MKFGKHYAKSYGKKTATIIVKQLISLQRFLRTTSANLQMQNDDITSQHSDILAMCCKVISSFVIFAVLDQRDGGCRP